MKIKLKKSFKKIRTRKCKKMNSKTLKTCRPMKSRSKMPTKRIFKTIRFKISISRSNKKSTSNISELAIAMRKKRSFSSCIQSGSSEILQKWNMCLTSLLKNLCYQLAYSLKKDFFIILKPYLVWSMARMFFSCKGSVISTRPQTTTE